MKIRDLIQEAPSMMGGGVDAKGRTQQQWLKLVKDRFPNAKIMQARSIDGPVVAVLDDGRKLRWNKVSTPAQPNAAMDFKPSPSAIPAQADTRKYPDPLEPYVKDGKTIGVVMSDGSKRPMSKSETVGPDGKVYNWQDPRGRKRSDTNEDASTHPSLQGWDDMSNYEKASALYWAGLVGPGYRGDGADSDEVLHQARLRSQERAYELEIGPEKLAELKTKAKELAEMQRQQLRQERIEDQKIAYERYKDEAERKDAMEKIDKEYKNNLEVINTEHRNNMEAIRTGNTHEIDKINLDHAEAARERQHEFDRDDRNRDRDDRKLDQERDEPEQNMPEPEDEPEDDESEPFRPQAPAGPALSAPRPGKKPSKYDTSDAIDVDFREVPDDEDKPRKPPQLPKPSAKESIELARIRQLAGLKENIFTTDYKRVMEAVAALYKEHYDIDIWSHAEAHDEAAKVLMKEHPTLDELDYIIDSAELPERFMDLDFPLNDEIMYGVSTDDTAVSEEPASRALCTSGKPDSALGASQLSSCKSQGYRSRDGGKTHKVGSERIAMRGKKIKGKKYGGPLPDWS